MTGGSQGSRGGSGIFLDPDGPKIGHVWQTGEPKPRGPEFPLISLYFLRYEHDVTCANHNFDLGIKKKTENKDKKR